MKIHKSPPSVVTLRQARTLGGLSDSFTLSTTCLGLQPASGEQIDEVPITYKAGGREAEKKLTAMDGLRVLRTLVRCRAT